jgi:hypothetical protein
MDNVSCCHFVGHEKDVLFSQKSCFSLSSAFFARVCVCSGMFNRFFGGKKEAGPPPPSLEDAQKSINGRSEQLDHKIKQLDKEISGYKQQMAKMRPGTAKEQIKRKAILVLKRKKQYESQVHNGHCLVWFGLVCIVLYCVVLCLFVSCIVFLIYFVFVLFVLYLF